MELAGLAIAVGVGVDPRRLALLAIVLLAPLLAALWIVILVWRRRGEADDRSVMFCEGVASELRSGSSLRDAIATAATAVEESLLITAIRPGSSSAEMAQAVSSAFPEIGSELEATIEAAVRSGSRSADLFDEIGSLSIAQAEVAREVRVASAPARATALVFLGAPTAYLVLQAQGGGLARLLSHSEQRVVAVAGLTLFVVGLLAASLSVWRAR